MRIVLLTIALVFTFFAAAQDAKTEIQQKTELLDSLLKTSALIHVWSGSAAKAVENSHQMLLTASSWEFTNGYLQLDRNYFFDLSHLVWFRMVDHEKYGKVLQLYFE